MAHGLLHSKNAMASAHKRKEPGEALTDEELAWNIFNQETADRRMAESLVEEGIVVAEDDDDPMIAAQTHIATCVACSDSLAANRLARAPCEHTYCGKCLTQLFQHAMTDEFLFPPRCCRQALPLEEAAAFFEPNFVRKF